ncbi:MAG TPA: zinc-binding dehydrogenase [Myxococcota bacterium]|nr:zinc-binding dehydrogenase [Myxococcota bacterium]
MRAAVFHGLGQPLTIEDRPDPKPGPGELVLQVKSCGICGSDLHASSLPPGLPPGTVMGHEFSGEVVEVGAGLESSWKVGDRACALPCIGCGKCRACLAGDIVQCATLRTTGLGQLPGAYSQYVLTGGNESLRLPAGVSFREGALVEPLAVGLHAVNRAELKPGERVMVIGAGPIGLAVTAWARFFGARAVIVNEKAPGRIALAQKFGATAVADVSKEDPVTVFQRETGGPPDVVFECVGVTGLLQQCIGMTRPRGRVVVVGVCMQPDMIFPALAVIKEVDVRFVVAYQRSDFELAIEMLDRGRIEAHDMITDIVGLSAFPSAFEALKSPTHQCKVILEP